MCGRYSVGRSGQELAAELGATLSTDAIAARFNVAPSQPAPMMVALPDRRIGLASFGWTLRGKKGLLLNARSETAPSNGLFRTALERRRALIPADGFYEWRVRPGIELRQVSSKVGSPANDDPSLQEPIEGTKTPAA